mgnify:CR=1 FL=1
MTNETEKKWRTPGRGDFTFDEVCDAIKKFIVQNKQDEYKISVGSDAQKHKGFTRFVTAIMVHHVGKGGQYYVLTEDVQFISSLRQKIMHEVGLTYQYKEMLKDELGDFLKENNIHIKPHADIGEYGDTKKLINEIKGMFKGFGQEEEVEIKPYSNAASSIANKHSK